eukprot:753221-Hanusia_phi.AAC.1
MAVANLEAVWVPSPNVLSSTLEPLFQPILVNLCWNLGDGRAWPRGFADSSFDANDELPESGVLARASSDAFDEGRVLRVLFLLPLVVAALDVSDSQVLFLPN